MSNPFLVGAVGFGSPNKAQASGDDVSADQSQQSAGDEQLKEWLDLSQSQVAALLGVSPQAVSKAIRDDGRDFLVKERRAQRLYNAMLFIGGDRYALPITYLKKAASLLGLNLGNSVSNNVSAPDLYASADEIWVVSDSPGRVIDWVAMKTVIYADQKPEREKVIVFFLSTLEGAENWAEALEREAIKPAIHDGHFQPENGRKYASYIFVIVSNLTSFSGEYVITNPGSRCMGMIASTKSMGMHYWNGNSYSPVNPGTIKGFVQSVHRNELGTGSVKAHFFPAGDRLSKDLVDFPPRFIDGLIGKLGSDAVGGILRDASQQQENTVSFNNRRKYTPAFLLAYKRKPGDSFNGSRTARIIQDELVRHRSEIDEKEAGATDASW